MGDSNPRYSCLYTPFPTVRLQPLGQSSFVSICVWKSCGFSMKFHYKKSTFICYFIIMFKEFIVFIEQYNIFGVAVWLLIATKVSQLVKGMIDDLVTPILLNPLLTKLKVKKLEDLSFRGILYGKVLSTLIDFLITAFLIFLLVKYANIAIKK